MTISYMAAKYLEQTEDQRQNYTSGVNDARYIAQCWLDLEKFVEEMQEQYQFIYNARNQAPHMDWKQAVEERTTAKTCNRILEEMRRER